MMRAGADEVILEYDVDERRLQPGERRNLTRPARQPAATVRALVDLGDRPERRRFRAF
jgi:hypothetical protein